MELNSWSGEWLNLSYTFSLPASNATLQNQQAGRTHLFSYPKQGQNTIDPKSIHFIIYWKYSQLQKLHIKRDNLVLIHSDRIMYVTVNFLVHLFFNGLFFPTCALGSESEVKGYVQSAPLVQEHIALDFTGQFRELGVEKLMCG